MRVARRAGAAASQPVIALISKSMELPEVAAAMVMTMRSACCRTERSPADVGSPDRSGRSPNRWPPEAAARVKSAHLRCRRTA